MAPPSYGQRSVKLKMPRICGTAVRILAASRRSPLAVESLESRMLLSVSSEALRNWIDPVGLAAAGLVSDTTGALTSNSVTLRQATGDDQDVESTPALPGEFVISATATVTLPAPPASTPRPSVVAYSSGPTTASLGPSFTVVCAVDLDAPDAADALMLYSTPGKGGKGSGFEPGNSGPGDESLSPLDAELTPHGIRKLTYVPMVSEVSVQGVLHPNHTWMTFRMPVGPNSRSLKLSVKAGQSTVNNMIPAVDDVYLVSRDGAILAAVKGAAANWAGPKQELSITLSSVPFGAQLLVRVVETPLPSAATPTAEFASQNPGEGVVPFVMDVKRLEMAGPNLPSSDSLASVGSPLTPAWSVPVVTAAGSTPPASRPSFTQPATASGSPAREPALSTKQARSEAAATADESDAPSPSVPVGPMVSVGSAPMGPSLGPSEAEQTLLVDRNERAFDLALEGSSSAGIDPELLPGVIAGSRRLALGRPTATAADLAGSRLLSMLEGPGGLPLMASAPGQADGSSDPDEILATLTPVERAIDSEGLAGLSEDGPPGAPGSSSRRGRRVVRPDFLTAAVGLVLGISLTSSPLYPDLLSLIRRRSFLRGRVPKAARPVAAL
ncbi:MAG: hypothetical protein U0790_11105 [Isosphaeraceae bacterium]